MADEKHTHQKNTWSSNSFIPILIVAAFVLQTFISSINFQNVTSWKPWSSSPDVATAMPEIPSAYDCYTHPYSTEIISIDPLVIYLRNFTYEEEIEGLLDDGEPHFSPSQIYLHGQKTPTQARTSSSAGLPLSSPFVQCILSRARSFMGTMLLPPPLSEFGVPQLVRYQAGQRFNEHHDWYEAPQLMRDGSGRRFNRVASFFVFLQDNCTKGETHFPYIDTVEERFLQEWDNSGVKGKKEYRRHKKGGIAFKPIAGNAIFWVNLFANGTGDERTIHAGLPVGAGTKTAMNIWPRKFY